MLTVNNVSKRFGDTLLFKNVSFVINPRDRIGLVGPNGSGKSTLIRMLIGDETRDSGAITRAPETTVGYLRQGFSDIPDGTLADLIDVPTQGLVSRQLEVEATTAALAAPDSDADDAMLAYEHASRRFETLGGYAAMAELEALLDRFGLAGIGMDRPLDQLSGGQKTRAGLAALLSARPDLLILDEPTNHLDGDAMTWLAEFLRDYRGAMMIVSHDRGFLDDVVTEILALDSSTQSLVAYPGNYSAYVVARRHEEEEAEAAWSRQQAEVARMKRDIQSIETKARSIEASTVDYAVRKKAAKIARPGVVRKKKLERMLDSEDAAAKAERRWGMSLGFAPSAQGPRDVVLLQNVHVSLGANRVLRGVDLLIRHGERVALLGPNGSGKTTLMRVITGEINPDSGTVRVGSGVRVGYFAQEQQTLDPAATLLQQAQRAASMSESDLRTLLHKFLFGGDAVHRRVRDLSYGERARLILALLVLREATVLLLDEPLNHLDIEAREEFEQALAHFQGTCIMVLHDRYAVERLATRVIELRGGKVVEVTVEVR